MKIKTFFLFWLVLKVFQSLTNIKNIFVKKGMINTSLDHSFAQGIKKWVTLKTDVSDAATVRGIYKVTYTLLIVDNR